MNFLTSGGRAGSSQCQPRFPGQTRTRDARSSRSARRGTIQVRVYNPSVSSLELTSSHLSLAALMDDNSAFNESIFVSPPDNEDPALGSGSPLTGMMD